MYFKQSMSSFKKIIKFIIDFAGRKQAFFLLVAVFVNSILDMCGIAIIFPYIKIVTNPSLISQYSFDLLDQPYTVSITQVILIISVSLILLYVCKSFIQGFLLQFQHRRFAEFSANLTNDTVKMILASRYGMFQEIPGSELANVAYSNIVHTTIVFRSLIQIVNEVCFLSMMTLAILIISPSITLLIFILFIFLATIIYSAVVRPMSMLGQAQRITDNDRYRLLYSIVSAIRDIKVMGLADQFDLKSKDVSKQHENISWRYNFSGSLTLLLVEVVALIVLVSSVMFIVLGGISFDTILPALGLAAISTLRTLPAFSKLMSAVTAYKFSRSFVDHLIFIRNRLEINNHVRYNDEIRFEQCIELRSVYFKYHNKIILNDVNLKIYRGQTIGIVGPSGSGKTTLLDLITGLQPATAGDFYCDNMKFEPFTSKSMESIIGYVPQVLTLLDESIAYNISFDTDPDINRLANVVKIANLEVLINELPLGLDTKVGENGINLSGGQRQRIGIARALYRQPKLVVFDESTSALDAQTALDLSKEIDKLRGKLTMLIVSHHLPSVSNCDQIYVIANGCIQDCGRHIELLNRCELYRDLYTLQTSTI